MFSFRNSEPKRYKVKNKKAPASTVVLRGLENDCQRLLKLVVVQTSIAEIVIGWGWSLNAAR